VADLLRLLAGRDDVLWANLWSLSGNWRFGAIHSNGWLRPVGQVLELIAPLLRGQRLPSTCTAGTVDTPATGVVDSVNGLPLVETLVSRSSDGSGEHLRVLLLNKHPQQEARGTLDVAGLDLSTATLALTSLHAPDPLRSDDVPDLLRRQQQTLTAMDSASSSLDLRLPPASVSVLDILLPRHPAHRTAAQA